MPLDPDSWHDIGDARELAPGEVKEVVAGDQIVAVANVGGTIHALDGICAHQGGPLGKGRLEGCTLTCPWHGWQYDAATGQQILSSTIRQATFAVKVERDRIWVSLSKGEAGREHEGH